MLRFLNGKAEQAVATLGETHDEVLKAKGFQIMTKAMLEGANQKGRGEHGTRTIACPVVTRIGVSPLWFAESLYLQKLFLPLTSSVKFFFQPAVLLISACFLMSPNLKFPYVSFIALARSDIYVVLCVYVSLGSAIPPEPDHDDQSLAIVSRTMQAQLPKHRDFKSLERAVGTIPSFDF